MENNTENRELTLNEQWYIQEDSRINPRLVFLAALFITVFGGFFVWWLPLASAAFMGYMLYMTLKDPRCKIIKSSFSLDDIDTERFGTLSLYGPIDSISESDSYNKMIDVLVDGNVIDKSTQDGDFSLEVVNLDPPVYKIALNQIGKTERQLVSACENSILAFNAYVVDVIEKDGSYIVSYKIESDLDVLASQNILYSDLLVVFENE